MDAMASGGKRAVYVGGLPQDTNEEILYQVFSTFGDINDVHIPKISEGSERHRGYGFITFSDEDAAEDAIDNMHLNELRGHVLTVNLAKPSKVSLPAGSRIPIWETEEWVQQYGGAQKASVSGANDEQGAPDASAQV